MYTYNAADVKASKIRGRYLKMKVLPNFLNPEPIDYFDSIRQPGYHEAETLKHFRNVDEETSKRVYSFYYDHVQGWTDCRGDVLTIENSVKYIKANLGLE